MNRNTWIIVIIVAAILAVAAYFIWGQPAQQPESASVEQSEDAGADDAMADGEDAAE